MKDGVKVVHDIGADEDGEKVFWGHCEKGIIGRRLTYRSGLMMNMVWITAVDR
jgi:hypothetical protein